MANSKRKTPVRKPAAVKEVVEPQVPAAPAPQLVQVMQPAAFQMVMSIIDEASVKGSDAGNVIMLKQELARVAGMTQKPA